jgi:hypothetical protein
VPPSTVDEMRTQLLTLFKDYQDYEDQSLPRFQGISDVGRAEFTLRIGCGYDDEDVGRCLRPDLGGGSCEATIRIIGKRSSLRDQVWY